MATNLKFDGVRGLSVACSHPTTPSSGDPVRYGSKCGVAINDENSDGDTVVDFGPAVYDLSVKGVNDAGNVAVAVGDKLYYVDADTPVLSKKTTSAVFFGYAMEAITSGATDTIKVMLWGA